MPRSRAGASLRAKKRHDNHDSRQVLNRPTIRKIVRRRAGLSRRTEEQNQMSLVRRTLVRRMLWTAIALSLMLGLAPQLRAQSIADFYRGKTLHVLIGYGEGGGYDIYGRLAAEFLGRHLPGNPTIIAQNMPGAGSFKAVNYLYEGAPKDGTYFGSLTPPLPAPAVPDQ